MSSFLNKEISNVSGNVLLIGEFNKTFINKIIKNKKITDCNLIGETNALIDESYGKSKRIRMSKLRKLKKKRVNYLICNDDIDRYLKTFIKDSIYITKDYIYITNNDINKIKKRYKRYKTKIEEIKEENNILLKIDVSKAKNNVFKELYYRVIDFFTEMVDLITDILLD